MKLRMALGAAALAVAATSAAGCGVSVGNSPFFNNSTSVEAPPPAADIARAFGDTHFKPCGQDLALGVFESGTAVNPAGQLTGIDTFPNQQTEDAWLKQAVKIGVAPFRESSTWVAYLLTGPASDPCTATIK
jgi:hypothetical protein